MQGKVLFAVDRWLRAYVQGSLSAWDLGVRVEGMWLGLGLWAWDLGLPFRASVGYVGMVPEGPRVSYWPPWKGL